MLQSSSKTPVTLLHPCLEKHFMGLFLLASLQTVLYFLLLGLSPMTYWNFGKQFFNLVVWPDDPRQLALETGMHSAAVIIASHVLVTIGYKLLSLVKLSKAPRSYQLSPNQPSRLPAHLPLPPPCPDRLPVSVSLGSVLSRHLVLCSSYHYQVPKGNIPDRFRSPVFVLSYQNFVCKLEIWKRNKNILWKNV